VFHFNTTRPLRVRGRGRQAAFLGPRAADHDAHRSRAIGATAQEQPGSLVVGGGAVGTLVFIEGALSKSNRSSSVAAAWSRAVR